MSEIMLLGILRMPLPDSPADMGVMEWMQVKDRMRQAADELEKARAELEGHLQLIEVLEEQRDAALARAEAAERERDWHKSLTQSHDLLADNAALKARANAAEAKVAKLREALIDILASLVASVDLLERGGKKAAPSDKMFAQTLVDYKNRIERGRAAVAAIREGGK